MPYEIHNLAGHQFNGYARRNLRTIREAAADPWIPYGCHVVYSTRRDAYASPSDIDEVRHGDMDVSAVRWFSDYDDALNSEPEWWDE